MSLDDPQEQEARLPTRLNAAEPETHDHHPASVAAGIPASAYRGPSQPARSTPRRLAKASFVSALLLALLVVLAFFAARGWLRSTTARSLPQLDGSLAVPGLVAPVTVARDAQGVPHLHAQSLDDLVFAQGFVTAQDRLFQMDTLRRHAAGELAEILGASLLTHDKLQRTLQIRAAADRALQRLPADHVHLLTMYANGVNAMMTQQRGRLPIEFRILGYTPAPWTPKDSLLVSLAMFEDLTDAHASKLAREGLERELPAELTQDLYPVGSWRDHPPTAPPTDLTVPGPPIPEVPLDETQSKLALPATALPVAWPESPNDFSAGSNNWVVSGAHTASGKPLLSNDMHLTATLPSIWYESDLETPMPGAEPLHVAGVTIPGLPLIVVGHNQHVAWGFTNLGADVQEIYIENTRGEGAAEEFEAADGTWQPVLHLVETIKVKYALDTTFDVTATRHGDAVTPILTPVLKGETRQLALRWTIYDPSVIELPMQAIATAHDWPSFLAGFAQFGGPAQNVVYADDQGHIGYHATGRVPMRGTANSTARTSVPADIAAPVPATPGVTSPTITATPDPLNATAIQAPAAPSAAMLSGPLSAVPVTPGGGHEWTGYIPFDQLPQVLDPPGGVIATANARVAPDDYKYPITLNWAAPYRNERIWHLLAGSKGLKPADMLAIEMDITSQFDKMLAERLAYGLDHSSALTGGGYKPDEAKTLRQAADLMRGFDGRMAIESPAAAIVASAHGLLWPMLLEQHLKPGEDSTELYQWHEKDYALEQVLMHTPPRWLPKGCANWDDFLAAVVARALRQENAPGDLTTWHYGVFHTVEVEHPIFAKSAALRTLLGRPTGTGSHAQSGDATTIKQVGHTFGPSERFTADLADLDHSTLNLVLGQSGNAFSPWFLDQFDAWYHGTTFVLPFSDAAVSAAATHTLTLTP